MRVSRSTYVPGAVNDAAVTAEDASAKATGPGPLAVHVNVKVPVGRPSSLPVPFRVMTEAGRVIAWSGPASSEGGAFDVNRQAVDPRAAPWSSRLTMRQ